MPDFRANRAASPQPWYTEPWVDLLISAYEADGPKATADRLEVSPSMVTAVARGYYESPVDAFRETVNAVLGAACVSCPVLGEITLVDCRRHRAADFAPTNPTRIRLWRTCPTCPNNPNR